MAALGFFSFHLFQGSAYAYLAIILTLVLLLIYFRRQRVDRENKNAELRWFSELHLYGKALAECFDPEQMAELTLQRTTQMLGRVDCYVLVQISGSDAISHVRAQGLSAQTVEQMSGEPLRSYLTSCGERWGNLMIFPDLSRPSLEVAWQRDALFHELRALCIREGLRTLVVVGLQVRESSYGVLLLGSRKPRIFRPNELRLLLAMGNQLGVALKRIFPMGTDASSHYRRRLEQRKPLLDTITALAFGAGAKDPYSQGHSQKVSRLAAQIARQMGLSQAEIEDIRLAGIVHDIGKIHVPEYVLRKPPPLTAEEFEIMKTHAAWSAKILEPLKVKRIERIVRHHHERYDGTGYPDGLKGEDIPLGARIVAVADCFHRTVSNLAYKSSRTFEDAVAELRRCSGTQFDPKVVTAFLDWLEIHGDPRRQQ